MAAESPGEKRGGGATVAQELINERPPCRRPGKVNCVELPARGSDDPSSPNLRSAVRHRAGTRQNSDMWNVERDVDSAGRVWRIERDQPLMNTRAVLLRR